MKDGLQENLDDLSSLEQFLHTLTPFQQRILALLSQEGLSHKEVAQIINRSIKTVERNVSHIVEQYRSFFKLSQCDVTPRKV